MKQIREKSALADRQTREQHHEEINTMQKEILKYEKELESVVDK